MLKILFACLMLSISTAQAYYVQTDPANTFSVIAINGLDINGITYNIEFVSGTYNDVALTSSGVNYFAGDYLGSIAAVDAIDFVLNTDDYDSVGPVSQLNNQSYQVLWNVSPVVTDANFAQLEGGSWFQIGSVGQLRTTDIGFASFTVVPVPAAAWLFGSALIGLAGIKRKK